MHDVLAHTLSGLVIQLDGTSLLARSRDADAELTEALFKAHGLARAGLLEARQAITALKGEAMPGPELLPALVEEHRHSTGRACALQVAGDPRGLPPETRLALYRAAQEALSNVRKHASGDAVTVTLSWGGDHVTLEVTNTAVGGDREGEQVTALVDELGGSGGGYGLSGMAERAELLGGSFHAGPTRDGFHVAFRVPVRRVNA
jgi:signal transduction histidine kinase